MKTWKVPVSQNRPYGYKYSLVYIVNGKRIIGYDNEILLHLIRKEKPESIRSLARVSGRDIKNVTNDVQYLARLGLLELNETGKNLETVVNYEKILLEIAV